MTTLINSLILIFVFMSTFVRAQEISFETNVTYKKNNQENLVDAKPSDKIKLGRGETILAISKQNVPLLIVSPMNESSQINISDANFSLALQEMIQPQLESATTEIISTLSRIDQMVQKRDYAQALQSLNPLKEKYPRVSTILFLSGTIHYLKNDKTLAVEDLEKGLTIDSQNDSAKHLLKKLKDGT